jgi:glycosyl transferase family 25
MLLNKINVMYINLEKRSDRKKSVIHELQKINIENPVCFKAIELENGALGCSMSHLKCLEIAKKNNYEYVFICEDDIEFLDPELFLRQFNSFFNSNIDWDVVLISGNNMLPYIPTNTNCIKILNCQTTTGYIVKNKYYDKLINNFKTGIQKLIKEPTNNKYKIDKYWLSLQRDDNWYLIIPLSVIQKEDYSDIEKKVTNFKKYMLDYNKAYKL